jgi:hypothetical protein
MPLNPKPMRNFARKRGLLNKQIVLPHPGKNESKFAIELAKELAPKELLFLYNNQVVELVEEEYSGELDRHKMAEGGLKFHDLQPAAFRTWVEQHVTTGITVEIEDKNGKTKSVFLEKTMSDNQAKGVLLNPQFKAWLPHIERILDVPIPIRLQNGKIVYPHPGYNEKLAIYCDPTHRKSS